MSAKKKYYVVWHGHQTGIFSSWTECQLQIKGFPGARYKSFESLEEAESALVDGPDALSGKRSAAPVRAPKKAGSATGVTYIPRSLCVDAACSGNPGPMEYQGVFTQTRDVVFHKQFPLGTNNIGEFLAIVHALAYCQQHQQGDMPIYSDSATAIKWVKAKHCKTQLPENNRTAALFQIIRRAELWLRNNSYANPLIKWETEDWGEIPADFGRK